MKYEFDAEKAKNGCEEWIRDWFSENGDGCNAIIGISGGKDSTVAAKLLAESLGTERVIGVLLPCHTQDPMSYEVLEYLKIKSVSLNIEESRNSFISQISANMEVSEQTKINLSPRLRMSALYAISQSMNGRVCNTCNYSEDYVGYSTLYGDSAGDFSPLGGFTVTEVKAIGLALGIPEKFINKVPSDGLCGKSDEESLGFSYDTLDKYIREGIVPDSGIKGRIDKRHRANLFKLSPMETFKFVGE